MTESTDANEWRKLLSAFIDAKASQDLPVTKEQWERACLLCGRWCPPFIEQQEESLVTEPVKFFDVEVPERSVRSGPLSLDLIRHSASSAQLSVFYLGDAATQLICSVASKSLADCARELERLCELYHPEVKAAFSKPLATFCGHEIWKLPFFVAGYCAFQPEPFEYIIHKNHASPKVVSHRDLQTAINGLEAMLTEEEKQAIREAKL